MNNAISIPHWTVIDTFREEKTIGNHTLIACGLAAQNEAGVVVTGSAAANGTPPFDRARYELIERILMIESQQETPEHFPPLPSEEKPHWKYSLSNGIAIHHDIAIARQKAREELIERDRILRSWYGEYRPMICAASPELDFLSSDYILMAARFSHESDPTPEHVFASFAFPKHAEVPFVFGFGCASDEATALQKSADELLQRYCFLHGEEVNPSPEFSPTPTYHQEIYLSSHGMGRVWNWLRHGHDHSTAFPTPEAPIEFTTLKECDGLTLVRAHAPDRIPLMFGKNYTVFGETIPESLFLHPIV